MKILITAPSLSVESNVSGVSSVASSIISGLKNKHDFYHYRLGRKDKDSIWSYLLFFLIPQLIKFPFFCKSNKIDLIHQNIPFDAKGIFREVVVALWAGLLRILIIIIIICFSYFLYQIYWHYFSSVSKSEKLIHVRRYKNAIEALHLGLSPKDAFIKYYRSFSKMNIDNSKED